MPVTQLFTSSFSIGHAMSANESLGGAENGDDDDDEESVEEEIIHCEIQIDETAVKSNEDDAKDENTKFEIDEVASLTPSDYDDQAHLFHMNILNESMVNLIVADQRERPKRYKNGTRKSLTFTNVQMREIERQNQILVRKIFTHSAPPSTSTISKVNRDRYEINMKTNNLHSLLDYEKGIQLSREPKEAAATD